MKAKKESTMSMQALEVATIAEVDKDIALDRILRLVRENNFRQILPPPVDELATLSRHELLKSRFGGQAIPISSAGFDQLVLTPTHLFSTLRRYFKAVRNRGPHVSRWFYMSPISELSGNTPSVNHELGMFILGDGSPLAHAHLINSVSEVLQAFGFTEFVAQVSSMGCPSCRKDYESVLRDHLSRLEHSLCESCRGSVEANPMTIWHCVNGVCQNLTESAPHILDFLDDHCRRALMGVLETIDELSIPYMLNPQLAGNLVRERITFEIVLPQGGKLGEGGTFSSWAPIFGEENEIPAICFHSNFEKLWESLPAERRINDQRAEVFTVPLGEIAARKALLLHRELRKAGLIAHESIIGNNSIKAQMKEAQDAHAEIALIIGQKEALDQTVILRDMRSGMQELFAADRIVEEVIKRLGK